MQIILHWTNRINELYKQVTAPYIGYMVTRMGFLYEHGLTLTPACICNYTYYEVWKENKSPFLNFNGGTVEVWEWTSYFIPHFTGKGITD